MRDGTILPEEPCILCGRRDQSSNLFGNGAGSSADTYRLFFCSYCQVARTTPFPTESQLEKRYAPLQYRNHDGARFKSFIEWIVRLERIRRKLQIQKYRKTGDLLDIGCGRGEFLALMRKAGWAVKGVEHSLASAAIPRARYGIDVITSADIVFLREESFDVITLYHVLEHVKNPSSLLSQAKRLLRRDGLLIVAVPNLASFQAGLGRDLWFHLDIPHHLFHFTKEGVSRLLVSQGFSIVNASPSNIEQNAYGWFQTLYNVSGVRKNWLYTLLQRSELKAAGSPKGSWVDIVLTMVLLPLFLPAAAALCMLDVMIPNRSATVELYCRKQGAASARGDGL